MRCSMKIDRLKFYIINAFLIALVFVFYIMPAVDIQFVYDSGNTPYLANNESESSTAAVQRKNIFYLRTHKTASTTIVNILMRYGYHHSLNFMIPAGGSYIGYRKPIRQKDMDAETIPPDGKFNIITHHTRYRLDTNRYLYPDTVRVTSLRDSPELFESLYQYFYLDQSYNMSLAQLIHTLSKGKDVIPDLSNLERRYGRNQMSRDLGFQTPDSQNHTEIMDFIQFVDSQFHVVMIKEYLEASLVLLADYMNWPLHFVSFISLNIRENSSKTSLSETDRAVLSRYNLADHLLYEYFLEKFRQKVLNYGFERMSAAIKQLHLINAKLRQRCIKKENYKGYKATKDYILRDPHDWECVQCTQRPVDLTEMLRTEQIERLRSLKNLENLMKFGANGEQKRGKS